MIRLLSEIWFIYFQIVLHEEIDQCFYYLPFDSNYYYYCDSIHSELPPFWLLGKDTVCTDNTAHQLKPLCLLTPFDGEFWLCWFLYEQWHGIGIIRSIQQSRRKRSNKNTTVWLLFWQWLRRTKKIWIKTRRISVDKITPTSNDEEQRFVWYNNCDVDTYATMMPRISIDNANKDYYVSASCDIGHLMWQCCYASIPINEEIITLPRVLYKRLFQSYGEQYWEQQLLASLWCYQ